MKDYLFNVGPLYVTYYVSSDFYNYKSGVYTDAYRYCTTQYANHGVLLVGYGTQVRKFELNVTDNFAD